MQAMLDAHPETVYKQDAHKISFEPKCVKGGGSFHLLEFWLCVQ